MTRAHVLFRSLFLRALCVCVCLIKCVIAHQLIAPCYWRCRDLINTSERTNRPSSSMYSTTPVLKGRVGGKKVQFKDGNSPTSTINSWENGEMTQRERLKVVIGVVVKETDDMSSLCGGRGCSNPSLTLRILICYMCTV